MFAPLDTDLLLGATKQRQLVIWQHNQVRTLGPCPTNTTSTSFISNRSSWNLSELASLLFSSS